MSTEMNDRKLLAVVAIENKTVTDFSLVSQVPISWNVWNFYVIERN